MKLHLLAFAYTCAIFNGLSAFVIMAYSLITGAAKDLLTRFAALHWVTYSWLGAILILIEYALIGFILGWLFAFIYNKFVKES